VKRNQKDPVQEASEASFPASDPPSWVASPRADHPVEAERGRETSLFGIPGRKTSGIPSDVFVWAGLAAAATALGFMAAGKKETSQLVGMWVPTLLLLGVYFKIAKTE